MPCASWRKRMLSACVEAVVSRAVVEVVEAAVDAVLDVDAGFVVEVLGVLVEVVAEGM